MKELLESAGSDGVSCAAESLETVVEAQVGHLRRNGIQHAC